MPKNSSISPSYVSCVRSGVNGSTVLSMTRRLSICGKMCGSEAEPDISRFIRIIISITSCRNVRKLTSRALSRAHTSTRAKQSLFNNNNNNNQISIVPYSRNFRGAGGRSDQCSVKVRLNRKVLNLDLKTVLESLSSR